MTDELPPLDPGDEEEQRSAAALARALDGGRAEPDLPQAALEAAALLRLSAGAGQLDERRKSDIRAALLEALPKAAARPRWRLPSWLALGLPLVGAAAGALLLLKRDPEPSASEGERASFGVAAQSAEEGAAREGSSSAGNAREKRGSRESSLGNDAPQGKLAAAAPMADLAARAQAGGARGAMTRLDADARELRADLYTRVHDPELTQLHADVDRATSRAELSQSRDALVSALGSLDDGLDPSDERLVRQDLYCRLAETALRLGEPRAALEWTRRGLELDGAPTPFLAQLSALEGDALAALGDDASAAKSYMKALRMHETLLDESLDGH